MNATVERFLQYLRHERNLSQRTVDTYRRNLEQWQDQVTATGRALDLASVTANDIRQWLIDRAARGDAPATLRLKVQALRALYRYLLRHGEVTTNPAAQVEAGQAGQTLTQVCS